MSPWLWSGWALSVLLLVMAAHAVLMFQTITAWKITLITSEHGHRISVVALLLAIIAFASHELAMAAMNVVSAFLMLVPFMQARRIARTIREESRAAFGESDMLNRKPLELAALFGFRRVRVPEPDVMSYGEDGDDPRLLWFYRSAPTDAPCIIALPTGSWENERTNEFPKWSAYWSSRGYAVAAVRYRLAPAHPWPAQREDVRVLLEFLKANAAQLGIDATRFVVLGRSAGAQIAVASAYALRDPAVRGCVSFYGPQDLFFARRYAAESDVLDSFRLLRNYLGGDPDVAGENYASASGYLLADASSPPTLLLHGAMDTLVWHLQSVRHRARLRSLGVRHQFVDLPWATHGFDWAFDGVGGQLARFALDHFLDAVCRTH